MSYTEKDDARQIEKFMHGARGNNENLRAADGVYFIVGSFQRNDDGRPYIRGFLIDDNKEKHQCDLLMHNPLNDDNVADRASREFRNGERKSQVHAKIRECNAGSILLVKPHEIRVNADDSRTLIADKVTTISHGPVEVLSTSGLLSNHMSSRMDIQKDVMEKLNRKGTGTHTATKNSLKIS